MIRYLTNKVIPREVITFKINNDANEHSLVSHRLITAIFLLMLGINTGCKKFVEIPPPVSQLVAQGVFNSDANATSAQLGIYVSMTTSPIFYKTALAAGYSGDELQNFSTDLGYIGYYTNSVSPVIENSADIWTPAYNYIYQANAVIEGLKNNSGVSPKIAQQLTGESEFLRAYWHFYLTNLFGDIPLVTTVDYKANATIARTPQAVIYQKIVADLKDAQTKLNTNFVDGSDTTATTARIRVNKWAATALLARVYLYLGDYQNAFIQSNNVVNNTTQFGLVTLDKVFTADNKEAIWQLQPVDPSQDTYEGYNFILTSTPNPGTNNCSTISSQLISAFEPNDARKANWIGSVTVGVNTYMYPNKYKIRTASTSEASTQLRLAEQYLIRAEAQAKGSGVGNGLSGAIADLNVIRNRAGLPPYAGSPTDVNAIFNAIIHERQIELFAEGGHRWFDLKRTGLVNTVMAPPGNVCNAKGGSWTPNWAFYPIPQTEINRDVNLTQNGGY